MSDVNVMLRIVVHTGFGFCVWVSVCELPACACLRDCSEDIQGYGLPKPMSFSLGTSWIEDPFSGVCVCVCPPALHALGRGAAWFVERLRSRRVVTGGQWCRGRGSWRNHASRKDSQCISDRNIPNFVFKFQTHVPTVPVRKLHTQSAPKWCDGPGHVASHHAGGFASCRGFFQN